MSLSKILTRIEKRTKDAYSYERYGSRAWRESIAYLLGLYPEDKVEIVLRSKHMRWAADWYEGKRGKIPTNTIKRWIAAGKLTDSDVYEMALAVLAENA